MNNKKIQLKFLILKKKINLVVIKLYLNRKISSIFIFATLTKLLHIFFFIFKEWFLFLTRFTLKYYYVI